MSDSSISNQIILLVAGLVLGSLVGFLSEVAKGHYSDLESRHVVRIETLPETDVACNSNWDILPAPIAPPTQCKRISFSLVREGNGSVSNLDATVSLNDHAAAIVSAEAEPKPEEFPPTIEITQSSSNERFNSRAFKISQFRSPQALVLTLFIGSQQPIAAHRVRIALISPDEKLVVLDGSDFATFYFICFYVLIFAVLVLAVLVFLLYSKLRSYKSLDGISIEG